MISGSRGFNLGDLPIHLPNEEASSALEKTDNVTDNVTDDVTGDVTGDEHNVEQPEEAQVQNSRKEPVFIPGTNVCLETEEDIKKWIEERRRRWPTKKNIELKKQEEIAARKRTREDSDSKGNREDGKHPKRSKTICKFFSQSKCKFGSKCKNSHEQGMNSSSDGKTIKYINNREVEIPQRFKNEPDSTSLFRKLVKKDQSENENELILKFVQFLDEKRLIDHDICIE